MVHSIFRKVLHEMRTIINLIKKLTQPSCMTIGKMQNILKGITLAKYNFS